MNEMQILGYGVTIVITLGSFVAVIMKFMQPINDLKVVIQELKDCVKALKEDRDELRKQVETHGVEIRELRECIGKIKTKIEIYHKHEG